MLKLIPLQKEIIADAVRQIIEQTGKTIYLEVITYAPCTVCNGNDPFCSTCNGAPNIATVVVEEFTAKVVWKNAERRKYNTAGQTFVGDARAVLFNTDGLIEKLQRVKHVVVDNIRCNLSSFNVAGIENCTVYLVLHQDEVKERIG